MNEYNYVIDNSVVKVISEENDIGVSINKSFKI